MRVECKDGFEGVSAVHTSIGCEIEGRRSCGVFMRGEAGGCRHFLREQRVSTGLYDGGISARSINTDCWSLLYCDMVMMVLIEFNDGEKYAYLTQRSSPDNAR